MMIVIPTRMEDHLKNVPRPVSGAPAGNLFFQSFTTTNLRPEDQFEAWRSLHAGVIDLEPASDAAAGCPAEFSSWSFGDLVLTRSLFTGAPVRHWRHRPKSYLDHWCVVLARGGGEGGDDLTISPPAAIGFRSLALPFEGQAQDAEVLTLFLPRDLCRQHPGDLEAVHDCTVPPGLAGLLAGYMDGLARQLPHIDGEQAEPLAAATRSLVLACLVPNLERMQAACAPISALVMDRARHVVRQNMASPDFGPEQLARLLAVSRSKLYRLFESTGGVACFINRERLREAHRRLTSPRDVHSIHVICTEVGFQDHSTFSRAFRREFGYSPTEARERTIIDLAAAAEIRNATDVSQMLEPMAQQRREPPQPSVLRAIEATRHRRR